MRTTVLHHAGRLPMFSLEGEFGARVGNRIKVALSRGKKTPILAATAEVTGLVVHDDGHSVAGKYASARPLKLGSGHLYARTTNAALFLRVLEGICCVGDGGIVLLDGEPSYYSSAAIKGGNRIQIAEGSSSLISAMHEPLDRKYHAALRGQLRLFFGAEFSMRELLIALPCGAAMEMADLPGRYAIPSPVPLYDLAVLNECDSDVLEEFCMAEAPTENERQGGARKIKELTNELMEIVRNMKNSVEMPGTGW